MEKEKLTISIFFVATYTTLIFTIPNVVSTFNLIIKNQIYYAFVFYGLIIDLVFFLYVSFYALEISSVTHIPFIGDFAKLQINNGRRRLFNLGIFLVFFSIAGAIVTAPIFLFLYQYLGIWGTTSASALIIFILIIMVHMLCREKSLSKSIINYLKSHFENWLP